MKEKNFLQKPLNDIISSSILFFLAYLTTLYLSISATLFISFTSGITAPFYLNKIDFEKATSGNDVMWTSSENIYYIFSFSPFVLLITALIIALLYKNIFNKSLSVFLFWMVFNLIMRINGDFILGHTFNLWSSNLVSDFLGLTYPNVYLKFLFIIISTLICILSPLLLYTFIFKFFNPFSNKIKRRSLNNFVIPVIIGFMLSLLWSIPNFSINEIGIGILAIISILTFNYYVTNRSLNDPDIILENPNYSIKLKVYVFCLITIVIALLRIFLKDGIIINASLFTKYQLESIFFISVLCVISIIIIIYSINIITRYKKKKKAIISKQIEVLDEIENNMMDEDLIKSSKWGVFQDNKFLSNKN